MNAYYVFVDESYDTEVFVLGVVWTKSLRELTEVKERALRSLGKSDYRFHYSDDVEKVRETLIAEIL